MNDLLNQLRKTNSKLMLNEDRKGFDVTPSVKDKDATLWRRLSSNADRIVTLLLDAESLIIAIEEWANKSAKKYAQAYTRFYKDYKANPYTWDAYDYLISWLNANERLYSAKQRFKRLNDRKNKNLQEIRAMEGRLADIGAYTEIAKYTRAELISSLLYHGDLYEQINNYIERKSNAKKKEEVIRR